jgi:hypothetical protein
MVKKKYLGLLWILGSLLGCSTTSKISKIYPVVDDYNSSIYDNISSSVLFDGINDNWQFIGIKYINGTKTYVYVPINETDFSWSERIEINHVKVMPSDTVNEYYTKIIKPDVNDQCYYTNPNLRILQKNNNDLIFAYNMKNCGKNDDQEVVGKIMRAPNSISVIIYSVKNNRPFETQQEQMLELVSNAKVIKD